MKSIRYILATCLAAVATLSVNGQDNQQNNSQAAKSYRMSDLRRSLTWADSYNAAGLVFMDFENFSTAEAFFNKENGKLVNYYQSDDSYTLGLRTESFTRLKKVVMYGRLEYANFRGENMTNTGLVYPERYLINVADSIPGQKRSEVYTFNAGVATPIFGRLHGGASINYQLGDMSKMRDLRHTTKLMDMEVNAGLMYQTRILDIGATYYYRKFSENVSFYKIAPSEINPNGFYYKGLWFGLFEEWNSNALTLSRPFNDKVNGVTVQLDLKFADNLSFFNEFAYKVQEGKSGQGRENALTVAYTDIYEYRAVLSRICGSSMHRLQFDLAYSEAANYDYITRSEKEETGTSVIVFYGKNRILQRNVLDLSAGYEAVFGDRLSPSLIVGAKYAMYKRNTTSSLALPYYYTQSITVDNFQVYARKNFSWQKGMLDLSINGGFSDGRGDKLTQHKAQMDSEYVPLQKSELLDMEYEYLTASRYNVGGGVRYSHFLPKGGRVCYADLSYNYTKAKEIVYLQGDNVQIFKVTVGIGF